MAIIAVDFDGVLCSLEPKPGMRMGLPIEGAIEAMRALKAKGHTLIIFTVRGERPKHVVDWCQYYDIPFDDITRIKPNADLFIDDKAATFSSWDALRDLWA
jgi:hypothetical protein